jgi:uncharacterized membrane protein
MYATEKYVRMEVKDVHGQIHELANDLGGDIRFLHQELTELRNELKQVLEEIQIIKEHLNAEL